VARPDFDADRALLVQRDIFPPLHVETATSLRDAVETRAVRDDTLVLVAQVGGATLALVIRQLLFHHLAQGEIAGQPWMVSY
jgi:hypothetical protein